MILFRRRPSLKEGGVCVVSGEVCLKNCFSFLFGNVFERDCNGLEIDISLLLGSNVTLCLDKETR